MASGAGKVRFLMDMAERFEADNNIAEAIKSAETALLLRRSLSQDEQENFSDSLAKQAQTLVMKCNAIGVEYFQKQMFDPAMLLLEKAIFLTEDSTMTNCFGTNEHDRLRLRAATYNNLGCMEKRRNNFNEALNYLQQSVEIETVVDPDVGASASTYMNLCTVLNKVGRHAQAASAAERAIKSILAQIHVHAKDPSNPAVCQQLMMSYYNLGVSLEFTGRPGDLSRAHESYVNSLRMAMKYGGGSRMPSEIKNLHDASERAMSRLESEQPSLLASSGTRPTVPVLPNLAQSLSPSQTSGLRAGSVPSTPSSVTFRPQPPVRAGQSLPPVGRGIKTANSSISGRRNEAMEKHASRIQAKAMRKKELEQRSQLALKKAQVAHHKEKEERTRREQEMAAKLLESTAQEFRDRMEAQIRADKLRQLKTSATLIQKVFRGFLTRDLLRDMAVAVVKMQAVTRSWLCRRRLRLEKQRAEERAEQEAILRKQTAASIVIQRSVRRFLNRLRIVREYRARLLRRHHSAKKIQNSFRAYVIRKEQRRIEQYAMESRARQEEIKRQNDAARRIQNMFRAFKSRRFMRVVRKEQARRNAAATRIQAAMRGCLTRAWFRHYRLFRRQQELSTAANIRAIAKIQRAWRQAIARRVRRRLWLEKRHKDYQAKLFSMARRIQCSWRCFVARYDANLRRRQIRRKHQAAEKIQSRWRVYLCRKEYIWKRDEARKMRALRRIQEWWRAMILRKKHVETARYHAALLRAERERMIKTECALNIQTMLRWLHASHHVEIKRKRYVELSHSANIIQRVTRGFTARKDCQTTKHIAFLVDQKTKYNAMRNKAACTIQRPVRQFLARETVNRLRREKAASIKIQSVWRMWKAKCLLKSKRASKRAILEDTAVRKIQRSVRLFFKRQALKLLDEYYTKRRRHKLWEQRRVEASTTIQALWRGYATRKATAAERARMLQRTMDAIRIQRAWRTHLFRQSIAAEMSRRARNRNRRQRAAMQLQCFWRRVLAQEYVAMLRERRFHQSVACVAIQCIWRRYRAQLELEARKNHRAEIRKITADRHDAYVEACTHIAMHLRTILAARQRLEDLEVQLTHAVREKHLGVINRKYNAATKIQANYRGHYERQYVRGLKKEKMERDAIQKALHDKQDKASRKIQRAVRSMIAKVRVANIRTSKRLAQLEEEVERETTANPHDIVKQLFWAHEAQINRNLTSDRSERHAKQNVAALTITRIVRGFLARKQFKRLLNCEKERVAAVCIQGAWKDHSERLARKQSDAKEKAAIKIQSIIRMFLVQCQWRRKKRRLVDAKSMKVEKEERFDRAATQIQSFFRGQMTRRQTAKMRSNLKTSRESMKQFEAARIIQRQFRRYIALQRVNKLRADRGLPPLPNRPNSRPGSRGSGRQSAVPIPPRRPNSGTRPLGALGSRPSSRQQASSNDGIPPRAPPRRPTPPAEAAPSNSRPTSAGTQ